MKKIVPAVVLTLAIVPRAHAALNYALDFDGINDFVRVPDSNSLDLSNGMTIEAWIKSNSTDGARVIVSKWKDQSPRDHSYIFKDHNNSDKLRIELSKSDHNDLADLEGTNPIVTGNWIHAATTYDMSNVRLFYNGAQDRVGLPNTGGGLTRNSLTDLLIGNVNGGEVFDGLIDEVRIWNYARSQQDLQDNMLYALNGDESGLVGYWNFDEGNGQTAHDLSFYLNHGQLGSTSGGDSNDPQWVLSDGQYGQERNVVPEPSTILLLGAGLLGGVRLRRRSISA